MKTNQNYYLLKMEILKKLLLPLLALTVVFTSCNKDDDDNENNGGEYIPTPARLVKSIRKDSYSDYSEFTRFSYDDKNRLTKLQRIIYDETENIELSYANGRVKAEEQTDLYNSKINYEYSMPDNVKVNSFAGQADGYSTKVKFTYLTF